MINAISITTYRVQGDSLPAMVVYNWRSHSKADKKKQEYLYLMVSRALNRHGFLCLEPLTLSDCAYFRPKQYCLQEDLRLNELSEMIYNNFWE